MRDNRKKFEEFAQLAGARREEAPHHASQPSKRDDQEEEVYPIPIPVARVAALESMAMARGEAVRTMLRQWVLERLDDEARPAERFVWGRPIMSPPYGIPT